MNEILNPKIGNLYKFRRINELTTSYKLHRNLFEKHSFEDHFVPILADEFDKIVFPILDVIYNAPFIYVQLLIKNQTCWFWGCLYLLDRYFEETEVQC